MIRLFGWEAYRFRTPGWEIQEQIEVLRARLATHVEQEEFRDFV